jgi:hypothetical protein
MHARPLALRTAASSWVARVAFDSTLTPDPTSSCCSSEPRLNFGELMSTSWCSRLTPPAHRLSSSVECLSLAASLSVSGRPLIVIPGTSPARRLTALAYAVARALVIGSLVSEALLATRLLLPPPQPEITPPITATASARAIVRNTGRVIPGGTRTLELIHCLATRSRASLPTCGHSYGFRQPLPLDGLAGKLLDGRDAGGLLPTAFDNSVRRCPPAPLANVERVIGVLV